MVHIWISHVTQLIAACLPHATVFFLFLSGIDYWRTEQAVDFLKFALRIEGIRTRDMTHSFVCYNVYVRVSWLDFLKFALRIEGILNRDMTHSFVCYNIYLRVSWLDFLKFALRVKGTRKRDMTHSFVCHDLCVRVSGLDFLKFALRVQMSLSSWYLRCAEQISRNQVTTHVHISHGTHMNESCLSSWYL